MHSDKLLSEAKLRMQKALEHLREELSSVRTGQANPGLLETIKVEAYGTKMDLRDLASINSPEPRLLVVQVWDRENLTAIEKAIRDAGLGLNPMVENNFIRVAIPPLSEERRKELLKLVGERAESGRVAIRQIRREVLEEIEQLEKRKEISEDERFRLKEQVQKITDEIASQIEVVARNKENEILQV